MITKEIFLNTITCPTLGWLKRSGEIEKYLPELSMGQKFRMEEGLEIHKMARKLYPDGRLIDKIHLDKAVQTTNEAINNKQLSTIFEGTFTHDVFVAKADILRKVENKWHLIEVKSSVNDREEFIDDVAYTACIITNCGLKLSKTSLLLVSKEYRLGMDVAHFFKEIDRTNEVVERMQRFNSVLTQINSLTSLETKPDAVIKYECRKCTIFKECMGKNIDNHIFDLPRLSESKYNHLIDAKIEQIENIPDNFPLTTNQSRIRNCVCSNTTFVDGPNLCKELKSIQWPAFYLDFETVMTAIPLYQDIAPYTQIPIQFSIHECSSIGQISKHKDYLAEQDRDCRKQLVEKLLESLGESGSIIIYSNFEKTVIKQLTLLIPDLADELLSLVDRTIDLEAIIRRYLCHPQFHGSTSLKFVFPALVEGVSYDILEIKDGDMASTAFKYLAQGKYKGDEIPQIKRNLYDYCKQDTLAMLKIHQQLNNLIE